jgi:hypothetical protein
MRQLGSLTSLWLHLDQMEHAPVHSSVPPDPQAVVDLFGGDDLDDLELSFALDGEMVAVGAAKGHG